MWKATKLTHFVFEFFPFSVLQKIGKRYFFIFFVISVAVWKFSEYRPVEVNITTATGHSSIRMSWKDKQRITYLFYKILIQNSGIYTLFGCKPTNVHWYIKPFVCSEGKQIFFESITFSNLRTALCWKTWEKYAYVMANSPYLLWAETSELRDHDFFVTIFLIDRKKFDETIQTYATDFQGVLDKSEMDGCMLLEEAQQKPLFMVLREHEGLVGTLLGYGRNNSWLFEERTNGKQVPLVPVWDDSIYEFLGNRPRGMLINDLSRVLGYPTFLADPNSTETKELKQQFMKARQQILDYYKGKDFLETTLSLLVGG